jgi:hypothetical protein
MSQRTAAMRISHHQRRLGCAVRPDDHPAVMFAETGAMTRSQSDNRIAQNSQ